MAGRGGLFAVMGPPSPDEEEEEGLDDFADDLSEDAAAPELDVEMGGPLDAYMETVFDAAAPMPDRIDAFRQAILTVIEERDRGGV